MSMSIEQPQKTKITVYMQDGRTFSYMVADGAKAREHAHAIITTGWRNVTNNMMEYYPVHKISKVTFKDPQDKLSKDYEGK